MYSLVVVINAKANLLCWAFVKKNLLSWSLYCISDFENEILEASLLFENVFVFQVGPCQWIEVGG